MMAEMVAALDVSRETLADLESFSGLVQKWTPKINLVSAAARDDLWQRHIIDSAQIYRHAPAGFTHWLDIGSGGGFPGIVVAIIGKSLAPDATFTLIESDQRKCAFLRNAIRELGLKAKVIADRIESQPPVGAEVVSARALGNLPLLLTLIAPHIVPDGVAILHKGRNAEQEVAEARKNWRFDLEERPSLTDPYGRILLIQRISRAS
jgi:16S rRNA (guanine527-N7)-methyltransferase